VTAKRGGQLRDLHTGDTISGDDEIATGDDGDVVIQLAHNHARFELGAKQRQVVAQSPAWRAANEDRAAGAEPVVTGAAARNAERAAALGAPSAAPADEQMPAPPAMAMPRADNAPVPPHAADDGAAPAPPTPSAHPKQSRSKGGLKITGGGGPGDGIRGLGQLSGGHGGDTGGSSPAPPPPTVEPTQPHPSESPSAGPTPTLQPTPAQPSAQTLLDAHRAALAACLASSPTPHASLTIHVDSHGRATVTMWDGVTDATARACVGKQLAAITWNSAEATLHETL
jgi:hypothetical protein